MDDTVSRKAAIDALRAIKHGLWEIDIPSPTVPEYVEHHEQIKNMMEIVDGWIKRINEEPATNRWIPIREQMPSNDREVLLQFRYNQAAGFWNSLNWETCAGDGYYNTIEDFEGQPIAWMPLPEPYKEEEGEL